MAEFKRATPADIIKIRQVAYKTWPVTFGQIIADGQLRYMLDMIYSDSSLTDQMQRQGHSFVLAEDGNQTIGFASYETNYHLEGQLMIHKLYILPEAQGLGIGTQFLNLLSSIARENNNRRLRLKVHYLNTKAITFYERYGFKKIGTEISHIGNNYSINDDVMVKELHR